MIFCKHSQLSLIIFYFWAVLFRNPCHADNLNTRLWDGLNLRQPSPLSLTRIQLKIMTHLRGGSLENESADESEAEDDVETEDQATSNTIIKSTIKTALKSKAQQESLSKATVKASNKAAKSALESSLRKTKVHSRSSSSIWKRIPYIVRISLNPIMVFKMTQAYFASLFNINFLQDVSLTFLFR